MPISITPIAGTVIDRIVTVNHTGVGSTVSTPALRSIYQSAVTLARNNDRQMESGLFV